MEARGSSEMATHKAFECRSCGRNFDGQH